MKDFSQRYSVPVSQTRPKGARLLEGYRAANLAEMVKHLYTRDS